MSDRVSKRKSQRVHFLNRWKQRIPYMEAPLDTLNKLIQGGDESFLKFKKKKGNRKYFTIQPKKYAYYTLVYDMYTQTCVTIY